MYPFGKCLGPLGPSILERLKAGRTTFLIAHRPSTVRMADRVVVLQEGIIAPEVGK